MTTVSGKKNTSGSTELLPESLLMTNDTLIKFPAPLSSLEETALKPVYFYKHKYCKQKARTQFFGFVFKLMGCYSFWVHKNSVLWRQKHQCVPLKNDSFMHKDADHIHSTYLSLGVVRAALGLCLLGLSM